MWLQHGCTERRTGNLLDPVADLTSGDGLVVDLAREQARVDRTERKRSSRLERADLRVVVVPRQLHTEDTFRERVVRRRQGLPERSCTRRRDGLPREAQEAGDGPTEDIARYLRYRRKYLRVNLEAGHLHGVLRERALRLTRVVGDRETLVERLEGARLLLVERRNVLRNIGAGA